MATEIVFTIRDQRGKKTTTSVKVVEHPRANVQNFAVAYADAIDNLIGGVVEGAVALMAGDISGLVSNVALASSDVEEIGSAQFVAATGRKVLMNIPSLKESLVDNATGNLDETEAEVIAFLSMMEDGITVNSNLIRAVDVAEENIVSHRYFRERSRSSGARRGNV